MRNPWVTPCLILLYPLIFVLALIVVNNITMSALAGEKRLISGSEIYIDAHNHLVGQFRSRSGPAADYYGAAGVTLAKILWSHVGWDNTGHRTAALTARLLEKHPNLYMSFKISPRDSRAETRPIERGRGLKAEWLKVIREFPNRFIIGSDQFYLSPKMRGQIGPRSAEPTHKFFSLLPPDLARKIGYDNPKFIFNLKD